MTNDVSLEVDVQYALADDDHCDGEEPPSSAQLSQWANDAYGCAVEAGAVKPAHFETTIRLVSEDEITQLNRDYRQKDKATNVLSFAFESPEGVPDVELALLGDIVICHPVIIREAREQNKTTHNHYAHMVTHGILHLCGYDHQDDQTAEQMESLETTILATAGIANPYQ